MYVRLEAFLLCSILIFTQVASKSMFGSLTGDLLNAVLCNQGVCIYALVSSGQTLFLMHCQAKRKRSGAMMNRVLLIIRSEKVSLFHVFNLTPQNNVHSYQLLQAFIVFSCKNSPKRFHSCKSICKNVKIFHHKQ